MNLSDLLKRKPRRLWSDEEIERHCESWAQNWVDAWNDDWGRIINKISDRTNLSTDNVLFAMGFVQSHNSAVRADERRTQQKVDRLEMMEDHRHWRGLNDRTEDVLIRIGKLLNNVEATPEETAGHRSG